MLRFILNLAIAVGLMWLFQSIGWIQFAEGSGLLLLLLTALVLSVIRWLMGWAYILVCAATCGSGCLLMPLYLLLAGWGVLYLGAQFSQTYAITTDLWPWGLVMGLLYSFIAIPQMSDE